MLSGPRHRGLTTIRTLFTRSHNWEWKGELGYRFKPISTRFSTNSLYTPMDNTPLHSISCVCHRVDARSIRSLCWSAYIIMVDGVWSKNRYYILAHACGRVLASSQIRNIGIWLHMIKFSKPSYSLKVGQWCFPPPSRVWTSKSTLDRDQEGPVEVGHSSIPQNSQRHLLNKIYSRS